MRKLLTTTLLAAASALAAPAFAGSGSSGGALDADALALKLRLDALARIDAAEPAALMPKEIAKQFEDIHHQVLAMLGDEVRWTLQPTDRILAKLGTLPVNGTAGHAGPTRADIDALFGPDQRL